jgi:hypothetical protein
MHDDGYPDSYHCICAALVRQIAEAPTWSTVVDAGHALLHVRLLAGSMKREHDLMSPTYGRTRSNGPVAAPVPMPPPGVVE